MKKILVTTDLSNSSKAGVKFAIQLASQYNAKLVFFNAIELLIPTRWNEVKVKVYMDDEIKTHNENLERFVKATYKECKKRPGKFECVIRYGAPVSDAILDFASEIGASFICMGTHGAGNLKRMIGTHTSTVIKKSSIPVFAIPKNYKPSPVKDILYASDLTGFKSEFRAVRGFAGKIGASTAVLHFDTNSSVHKPLTDLATLGKRLTKSRINFHLEKYNWEESMNWHIMKAVRKFQPDVLAMFTDNKRSWLEKLITGSKSVEVSFNSLKPILVFPK